MINRRSAPPPTAHARICAINQTTKSGWILASQLIENEHDS
jgi:hypothetical protein